MTSRVITSDGVRFHSKLGSSITPNSNRAILTAHGARAVGTRDAVRVVAGACQAAALSGERQSIGTGLEDRLVGGRITFVVIITILFVGKHRAAFAFAGATKVDRRLGGRALGDHCVCVRVWVCR